MAASHWIGSQLQELRPDWWKGPVAKLGGRATCPEPRAASQQGAVSWGRVGERQERQIAGSCVELSFFSFFPVIFISWRLITILEWFLPYIDMNQPWIYVCSPSWTPHPSPSPSHPSGSWTFLKRSWRGSFLRYSSQIEGFSFSVKGYNSILPSLLPIG